jgi:hypothetical protein
MVAPRELSGVLKSLGDKENFLGRAVAADRSLHVTYWLYRLACEM